MTTILYTLTVLIWGTSWIMFEFQEGMVPAEVSGVYRFGISAVLMFLLAHARGAPFRFSGREHVFLALQGILMFALNIFFLYLAAQYIPSGLNAVVFSMASIISMVTGAMISQRLPLITPLTGALIGVVGVTVIFWPEIKSLDFTEGTGLGLLLSLAGTTSFALSVRVGERNQKLGLGGLGGLAWAMTYGTMLLCVIAIVRSSSFTFDYRFAYVGSLVFLIIVNSVAGFSIYFALINRIGADRAAYVTILFPLVALMISTIFENYHWSVPAFIGVTLTLIGNVLVLRNRATKAS